MKNIFWTIICSLFTIVSFAQNSSSKSKSVYPLITADSVAQTQWVDSTYANMTLDERIGQLFMVDLFPEKSQKNIDYVTTLIRDYHVGGVIFFKGHPTQQAQLTNEFQKTAKTPLLVGQDAEWGLAMRLDSTYAFPWNMTLGAIDDNNLIKQVGAQMARHAKRVGLQFDFAPSVDVNINPKNPIIGNRAFGEDPKRVAEKGIAFMEGMQGENVLTTAKHFPGHGDTEVDSHKALPVLDLTRERLDSVELYPYRKMIPEGLAGVMVSHLSVPALDSRVDFPASLSKPIITGILKNQMDFKGLIVTDALNMKGVSTHDDPGKVSLEAFQAGNDILLYPVDVPAGIKTIKEAYQEGTISEERLAYSVKKILRAKYKTGLQDWEPVSTQFLVDDLNAPDNDLLYTKLMENAITLIKNNNAVVPIRDLDKKKIAYVPMGDADGTAFYKMLNNYTKVDKVEAGRLNELLEKLKDYDQVIIGFHKSNASPWVSYKFSEKELIWLHEISIKHSTILNVFTRPYAMLDVRSTTNLDGIVMGYQNSVIAQETAAQILFGALGAKGRLPVSLGSEFPVGTQFKTKPIGRLTYGAPESVGMSSLLLNRIDSIANVAITKRMTPGLQVLVARKGKVVFNKSYGYHTYDKKLKVKNEDVYDLASVTKVLGTLPLIMELEEQGELSLDTKLGEILPFLKDSNKADITLKRALSHYAQINAWIPFYKETLDKQKKPSSKYYYPAKTGEFGIKVTDKLFMRTDYQDSIYQRIAESDLYQKKEYRYSDLIFYLMKKYLEDHYKTSLAELVETHFYESLGADRLTYLPLQKFSDTEITPSEVDNYWRNQKILGYVNDQGAAMFGSVGGHAGLFGNANDVAKMMQLYLNGGSYGGKTYLKPQTLELFNTCYYCDEKVRRGVGFDKPQLKGVGPGIDENSKSSFGHTGFTGTMVWADPEEELLYVFLSNRTYPDPANQKLIRENIRTEIEKMIYESIIISDQEESRPQ